MRKPLILVVDDDLGTRELLRRILEPVGYEVCEAGDGREALSAVQSAVPDLVLLDAVMPNMDGYALCASLKKNPRTKLVPVVMVTSLHELPDKLRAVDLGADDFLTKPFLVPELLARVRSLLARKGYTDELEHASKVLEGIALMVESRDCYTGNHCKRLAEYGARVGAELKLGEEDLGILRVGGIMHDVGKVVIPDAILNKPGRLTPEEYALMRTHSVVGAQLCGEMRTMERIIPLIRNHHEKLDGSGYPDGLRGSQIPLLVRIVSVVDVYDALATRRSYKESFPRDTCLSILRAEAGRGWWDPDVVEALARTLSLQPRDEGGRAPACPAQQTSLKAEDLLRN